VTYSAVRRRCARSTARSSLDKRHHVIRSPHELEVALANVRVVVECSALAGDPIHRGVLASFVTEDEAAPLLFVGRGDQRPRLVEWQRCSAQRTCDR
jgi:hypothetical protein